MAWVSIHLAAKCRIDLDIDDLEAMWLEMRAHNNKFLLITIYRPPNKNVAFWDNIPDSINLAKESDIKSLILCGDLNCDFKTNDGEKLKQFAIINHLIIHI